ncbi:WXG100 family type VII secretion target [Antrihabitans sp. YC3-6]|uniref:ESAT-6-like protein n=1 Tax=Antrihabitans stalagmiti TaxID=2799499 RepID=A0A934NP36_9NOCA|nr:WXG100 family type VII secretion target [Antrihabitans stalagmiti]MBJ8338749.1 WXG100 family type VII secretion target [Antrihabitans stalagmiti]
MTDKVLRVDTGTLRQGSGQFTDHHTDLREVLDRIHRDHDGLQETWTGGAADSVAEVWSDLRERIDAHIGKISYDADGLGAASTAYDDQERASAADFDATAREA